jgi:hypothetical protein
MFTWPGRAPKRSPPPSTAPADTKRAKSGQQDYISTTLQVTRTTDGSTDKSADNSTFTLDLPLDTPFRELDTIIKPIIDPNSAAGETNLSAAVGQSLTST